MEQFLTIFNEYGGWAILLCLVLGSILLVLAGYINWHGTAKTSCINWIVRRIYHERAGSEKDAENVFGGITTFLVAVGIMLVATAFLLTGTPQRDIK